ncbi:MAG TPA: PfkB family carbohydrate kinase [Solirubrobacteraceae bacterium]|jgi:sugar/nucleoside kinase (ribokinase family)|nr:PfkB family carbohydrate kinase [Solirubrobacteraceae bacterium]
MSITVVGSIAYDAVKTPFGKRERMLGGAATHFSLAASLFDTVRPVGPVGGDFAESDFETLRTRGTLTDDVEVVADGKTFFWSGRYGWDLNSRDTLDTQLGVFGEFQPRLSEPARDCDVLFLANIQPTLQASVLDQCRKPRWVGLDSMNFWIDSARAELIGVIERVDCVVLNDDEFRQLTGKPSLPAAAREILAMGPSSVIAKQGKYGAVLFTKEGFFALPAYPLEKVVDPTGAGDAFAGGLAGYVASQGGRTVDHGLLATAMAYGTSVASFNVEEFGTERVARLTLDEVNTRVNDLHRMTQFTHSSVEETIA